jgi:Synaptobrevin
MALDGHFIVTTSSKQLIAGWVSLQDEDFSTPKPCLFKPIAEQLSPEKKRKSFLGIKLNSEVKLHTICKNYAVEKPASKFTADDEEDKNEIVQVHETKNAVEQALKNVSERGDKIKSLDVKIKELAEKSKNFSEMAAQLAKKQKKWW